MSKQEPVLTIASLQAVIAAVLFALVQFDVWIPTEGQQQAIFALYAVLAPLLFAWWARSKVTPSQ